MILIIAGGGSGAATGIDVIMFMRLQETAFGSKKDFLTYLKGYLKTWEHSNVPFPPFLTLFLHFLPFSSIFYPFPPFLPFSSIFYPFPPFFTLFLHFLPFSSIFYPFPPFLPSKNKNGGI